MNCPLCAASDQVAKVSAIVRDGTSTHHTTGTSTIRGRDQWDGVDTWFGAARQNSTTSSQSALAAQLSFPDYRDRRRTVARIGVALIVFSVLLMSFGGLLALLPALVVGIVVARMRRNRAAALVPAALVFYALAIPMDVLYYVGIDVAMGGALASMVIAVGMTVAGVTLITRNPVRSVDGVRAHAAAVWQRLYYCFRDDVVFDPATGYHGPPHALRPIIEQAHPM